MHKPIEFKAGSITAMTAVIRELDNVRLADSLHTMMGGMGEFFADEATVIDLTQLSSAPDRVDWAGLGSLLRRYGLQPVALKGTPEHLVESARKAGLAVLGDGAARVSAADKTAPAPAAAEPAKVEPVAAPAQAAATMIIERPIRSGQQIYARGGDLVILGGVSNGAEVIADGSIHCYGPLRGRALAGAQGDTRARLLCTNFGPELVSIAGVYRTFERGVPENLAAKPAHAVLREAAGGKGGHTLNIEPLQLD
ncbi:septum site-determining protein MinC [Uliginosibacterium sp. sgz301328]|uniref:septum site-determining protein MinC n=1 Tax=Uliginosibacterium sp. sgz301328 TaxID=3243764 RepID=UPI00359E14AE